MSFDNSGYFEQAESESAVDADMLAWDYLTLDEWTIREGLLNNLAGTKQERKQQAKASFEAKIMERGAKTKYVLGQHLVGVFKGLQQRVGEERRMQHSWAEP